MRKSAALVVALVAAAVAPAIQPTAAVAAGVVKPAGTYASVQVLQHGQPKSMVEGTVVTFTFANGMITADAGFNYLSEWGPVITADTIKASMLLTTEKACWTPGSPRCEGLEAQDRWLADFMSANPTWSLSGTTLTLKAIDSEIVLVAQPDDLDTWMTDSDIVAEG